MAYGEETEAKGAQPCVAKHSYTDTTARIEVQGVEKPLRVLQITDLHLNLYDERDQEHVDKLEGRHRTFLENNFLDQLRQILAEIPEMAPDLIVLTGDIFHFPSQKNVETLKTEMDSTGVPWLYMPGNHDYYWPYMAKSAHPADAEELRLKYLDLLRPLTDGADPLMQSEVVNGIRFVCIDNSTYVVSAEQHRFFQEQVKSGEPVVLLVHIPLYAPALREAAVEVWKPHSLLMGDTHWTAEERKGWGAPLEDTPETLAFVESVKSTPNLIAVLSGHVHFPHAEQISENAYQYVGRPPFDQLGRRVIDIVPYTAEAALDTK
jgi:DNA repair exonuclease SbcCD nuclease subunit